jgi:hypothetical protein
LTGLEITMTKTFYSKLFFLAAIFNCTAGIAGIVFYEFQFSLFFGDQAVMKDFHTGLIFRLFMFAVLLFGLGYYFVSRDPEQNRGIVWLGALGKVGVFAAFTYAFLLNMASAIGLSIASMDLFWAVLFFYFLFTQKK